VEEVMQKNEYLNENSIKQLSNTSDMMSALFASIDDGIIVSDETGRIVFANSAALRIYDNVPIPADPHDRVRLYSRPEGQGTEPIRVEDLPTTRALCEGEISGHEIVMTTSKNHKKVLICNGRALYNHEGQKIGSVLVFHDKTRQVFREKQIDALELEKNRLLQMNAELERFSAVAAHDLKSPLNSITQFAELLKEEHGHKLGNDGLDLLQVIVNAGHRLRTLIDDLLSYARSGKNFGKLLSFDSRILVDEILTALQAEIKNTNAQINIGNLPVVWADRTGVWQVFQNLISNSLKYRGNNSPVIDIQAIDEGDAWRFQVSDNGVGFRVEDQKSAFDLFARFEGSNKVEGTGLGLPICKRIIESHGGSLWLTSQFGEGSTFYFTLPKSIIPKRGNA
jgi:signal transduction histidine kinase